MNISEKEHWIEAEEWLEHCYPKYEWRVWHWGSIILVSRYIGNIYSSLNLKSAQVPQATFREWVSITDFQHAMNHLLHMNFLVHWKDFNWSEYK